MTSTSGPGGDTAPGRRIAIAVFVATVVVGVTMLAAVAWAGGFDLSSVGFLLTGTACGIVGAVILYGQPQHRIGWVMAVIGITFPLGGIQTMIPKMLEVGIPEPTIVLINIPSSPVFWSFLFLLGVLLPLWFPTGRPLTPRWRWPVWLGAVGVAAVSFLDIFGEQVCLGEGDECYQVANPIGIPGLLSSEAEGGFGGVFFLLLAGAAIVAIVSLVVRFIRSRGVERLQIKWVAFTFAVLLVTVLATDTALRPLLGDAPWVTQLFDATFSLAILAVPVSIGIAVTRYRLYDLGLVVSRTIAYGALVALLGFVFAVGAVWLPQRLPTADNNLAVAASTLAVAALFNPLRRRIQRIVDRRFHRTPYDPERVTSQLASSLRDAVDPDTIKEELLATVTTTLHPRAAGVWTRPP